MPRPFVFVEVSFVRIDNMAAKGKRAAIIQMFMNWCIYFSQCMNIVVHGAFEMKAEASFRFQKQQRISEVLTQLWTIVQISIVGWRSG
ncbi:hypothetical protein NC652_015893 [Populus alba x Populus x berolinensis]|nr:hypothetical protein NC652_015893 [Populus alba x Populus x berolinensis]